MKNSGNTSAPLIEAILSTLPDNLGSQRLDGLEQFIQSYFCQVPESDLATVTPEDFGGAAISHWQLMRVRLPGQRLVKIYNPRLEQHGWHSSHTVIEIVTDDMPHLVNSISMAVSQHNANIHLTVHPIIAVERDEKGQRLGLNERSNNAGKIYSESVIHLQIDCLIDPDDLQALTDEINGVLFRLANINDDAAELTGQAKLLAELLENQDDQDNNKQEAIELLKWLDEKQFHAFGSASFETDLKGNCTLLENSELGLLRGSESFEALSIEKYLPFDSGAASVLSIAKANSRSPIARPEALDIITVKGKTSKVGDAQGFELHCLVGLFTQNMNTRETLYIPVLRHKTSAVIEASGLAPESHDCKALKATLENLPRDILFQAEPELIAEIANGIVALQERNRIRLFATLAPNGLYYNCLVFIPRDSYGRELRLNIESILITELAGSSAEFSTRFSSQSTLARLHYVVRLPEPANMELDWQRIENRILQASITWDDRLHEALLAKFDEHKANQLFDLYRKAFPSSYKEDYSARIACSDIDFIETKVTEAHPVMSFYRHILTDDGTVNFKLFSPNRYIALSDVIPMIENMGLRVDAEHPFQISRKNAFPVWIHEFTVQHVDGHDIDPSASAQHIQDAFVKIWSQEVEDDGFNRLMLEADLNWRQIIILRSYCKYLQQIQTPFSQRYMIKSLVNNASITQSLVQLFENRFNPALEAQSTQLCEATQSSISKALTAVDSLDEDRILRAYLNLIQSTLRTNYYVRDEQGEPLSYVSYKLDSSKVGQLPLPRPRYEIFVYSTKVEGIHLRGGKVARGGLRWSDRREDFRTEVLGLMKAQMVKNAVIVPVGSKGGFYVKRPPLDGDREAQLQEGIACYQTFLRGMLDITDNIVDQTIVPPTAVRRYDEDDPYLVVAADKGTATFSDYANNVAESYGFWLGDAFASGGSVGYDHKKMGITARGAWESVKRHFREIGLDTQSNTFSVVGIGDMAGDVFGNGMLLSQHIKLVAAFNHLHIFIDPTPNCQSSYDERKRLFELPRSSWEDYNTSLISAGGGIYSRNAKQIELSNEACNALGIEPGPRTPNELINQLLKADIDLLWNGGIGTYIKATSESHAQVRDRANDSLRVNGSELRCKVVGEGGNLGCTQLGRIEIAQNGGRIYTDAIDNSAGVDCSDHEVNIKILVNAIVKNGDMTRKQRDELLSQMTDEVGLLVLKDNYLQTQCINLASVDAPQMLEEHARFIAALEDQGLLHREIEYLPSKEEIADRLAAGDGLFTPELAVIVSYSKMTLYERLLDSALPEEGWLQNHLQDYFPTKLRDERSAEINQHRLRREIIATVVANELVNRLGPTFLFRMEEELGAKASDVARSFVAVCAIFEMAGLWQKIEALDNKVAAKTQSSMQILVRGLVERSIHLMLRSRRESQSIEQMVKYFKPGITELLTAMPECLASVNRKTLDERCDFFVNAGTPANTALEVARVVPMSSALDIVEIAKSLDVEIDNVAGVYFDLGLYLDLQWLRDEIAQLTVRTHWHNLAKSELRSDLHYQHRHLCAEILTRAKSDPDPRKMVMQWSDGVAGAIDKYSSLINDMKGSSTIDFAMLSLALNEVHKLLSSDRPLGNAS